jgi:hypothetical protein
MASNDEGTVRITMRLPVETKDELYSMCNALGLQPWNVFPVALIVGVRTLVQNYSLDQSSEMWNAIKAAGLSVNRVPQIVSDVSDSSD